MDSKQAYFIHQNSRSSPISFSNFQVIRFHFYHGNSSNHTNKAWQTVVSGKQVAYTRLKVVAMHQEVPFKKLFLHQR